MAGLANRKLKLRLCKTRAIEIGRALRAQKGINHCWKNRGHLEISCYFAWLSALHYLRV